MSADYDLILLGAGLANALIAWRLTSVRPGLRILLIDSAPNLGGDRTWSFHATDLTAAQHDWIAPLVDHRWEGHSVAFPGYERRLSGGYLSIDSRRFFEKTGAALAGSLRLATAAHGVDDTDVTLSTGERVAGAVVLDGRGPRASQAIDLGWQKFLGRVLRLEAPHGLTQPIVMDATVPQTDGFRFVYTLPLDERRLLVEDTYYADAPRLDADAARAGIDAYARDRGWQIAETEREERGALPILLGGDAERYRAASEAPETGLRGLLFHATTGYSLPSAVALADRIAAAREGDPLAPIVRNYSVDMWRRQRFYRMLNRMMFLAAEPRRRWTILARFYRLPEPLIARFYAGALRPADKARILVGRPPVPLHRALAALPQRAAARRAGAS